MDKSRRRSSSFFGKSFSLGLLVGLGQPGAVSSTCVLMFLLVSLKRLFLIFSAKNVGLKSRIIENAFTFVVF